MFELNKIMSELQFILMIQKANDKFNQITQKANNDKHNPMKQQPND